jgi:hypothetical protein
MGQVQAKKGRLCEEKLSLDGSSSLAHKVTLDDIFYVYLLFY